MLDSPATSIGVTVTRCHPPDLIRCSQHSNCTAQSIDQRNGILFHLDTFAHNPGHGRLASLIPYSSLISMSTKAVLNKIVGTDLSDLVDRRLLEHAMTSQSLPTFLHSNVVLSIVIHACYPFQGGKNVPFA